jgi:hypothetical protein
MSISRPWRADVFINEDDGETRAEARLHNPDETGLIGVGLARRNPHDMNIAGIGDEMTVARATQSRSVCS